MERMYVYFRTYLQYSTTVPVNEKALHNESFERDN